MKKIITCITIIKFFVVFLVLCFLALFKNSKKTIDAFFEDEEDFECGYGVDNTSPNKV